ncbi:cyclin-dependent kinase 11B [Drosophila rhopaloa]|uniref:Cyclin-dependent kinase 11B n=1 Tax=Drosophila rhopaloa TaxID=1041015 RepID=A0A6P4EPV4_DRORH|nr:cyclin-dependent kinase 11B [Drosophila rhopaloa]
MSELKPRASPAPMLLLLLAIVLPQQVPLVAGGSCREAQLCCTGRDSSCVVQKAPINAIIEDLSDKPCYCDHACLKLGDCCDDFKDHCGVLDCQVGDFGAWSECDKSCGTGMMTRTRQILQAAQNGGKHCPTLQQKRSCQGYRCHGHHDKKILREMALLLPAALSHNHHVNDSSDIRRNLRTRYRDSYKHNHDQEYCVEFEVIKASKACHKLPPYNLMLEGDRITVRCDLEALIQDSAGSSTTARTPQGTAPPPTTTASGQRADDLEEERQQQRENSSGSDEEPEAEEEEEEQEQEEQDDLQNALDTDSNESSDYRHQRQSQMQTFHSRRTAGKRSAVPATPPPTLAPTYHCRGEGLAGRTTRWSALPAPSCRGKWLRLTVGPPKKCGHAQFIFV